MKVVPQLFMVNALGENVDYSNYGYRNKNCYLLISSDDCEDCYFGNYLWNSKNCMDCLYVTNSQVCYELTDSHNCYHCFYSDELENCNDCFFSYDLKGCQNCVGCIGLRHKSYCWFNEQLLEEGFKAKLKDLNANDPSHWVSKLKERKGDVFHRSTTTVNCEDCLGDHIKDCKNAKFCFDSYGLEDSKFIVNGPGQIKNCYDFCGAKELEASYQGISTGGPGINLLFNNHAWSGCANVIYGSFNVASQYLFGCAGVRHKKYCILNKQYSKEVYEELAPKIIEHMSASGEWGEFFPIRFAFFHYNETLANDLFPLDKEAVLKRGWKFREEEGVKGAPVQERVKKCADCGKNYKMIDHELHFYQNEGLAQPEKCPDCRHKIRMNKRNPYKLWKRQCSKCGTEILSTYAPQRSEKICCQQSYLSATY